MSFEIDQTYLVEQNLIGRKEKVSDEKFVVYIQLLNLTGARPPVRLWLTLSRTTTGPEKN